MIHKLVSLYIGDGEYYTRIDADLVMADKDREIAELQKQVHDYAQGLYVIQARAEKELRYQKRKRCLAMAKWCRRNRLHACVCGPVEKIDFFGKWRKRWLELAKKFKEAK